MAQGLHNFFPVHFMPRFLPLLAVCLSILALALRAAPPTGEAEVGTVRFKLVRPASGAADAWLEADVVVNAHPSPGSAAGLLPRVRLTLTLAPEIVMAGAPRQLEFFRASAEAVALRAGLNSVRFYLPPELVLRDALRGDVRLWRVEVSLVGGKNGASTRFSTALGSAEARKAFAAQAAAAAAENDGLLLPQYLTPFAPEYPNATPSFVRRESAR